jgi:hypothetical protein
MAGVSATQRIEAPVSTVFNLATDLDNMAGRIKAITRIEKLTPGPVGVGTRFKETRKMFGKEATETMEFTEFEPNRRYVLEAHSCGCHYRTEFRFDADGSGTLVSFDFTATPQTLMAKLMSPMFFFMKGMMKKCVMGDLADLKSVAEGAPAAARAV